MEVLYPNLSLNCPLLMAESQPGLYRLILIFPEFPNKIFPFHHRSLVFARGLASLK